MDVRTVPVVQKIETPSHLHPSLATVLTQGQDFAGKLVNILDHKGIPCLGPSGNIRIALVNHVVGF